jgi:serine O-acetyltransferase
VSKVGQDLRRWKLPGIIPIDGTPLGFSLSAKDVVVLLWRRPAIWATLLYRASSWCSAHGVRVVPSILERLNFLCFGLDLSSAVPVGSGLYIPHPSGMVLMAERIGANCSFIHACTVGMREGWDFPVLGDAVFVGAGARVLGGISVGDGSKVGANAVVIDHVPAGATAVGVPARILGESRPQVVGVG